jgi:hypothetical protein
MDKLLTVLMMVVYFTGLYAIGKGMLALCDKVLSAFR